MISNEPAQRRPRAHRSDGDRSRSAILDAAARLATTEGIGGLSMSRLADAVGMSKSGLFAHFGSKEELQLATIEKADSVFSAHVIEPALAVGGGLGQLRTLVSGYLAYLEADTFPGGCFFASVLAEVDTQPGAVRDRLVRFLDGWLGRLETAVRDAQADGAIDPPKIPPRSRSRSRQRCCWPTPSTSSAGRQNRSSVPAVPSTGASPPRAPRPQPQPATSARLRAASHRAYFVPAPLSLRRIGRSVRKSLWQHLSFTGRPPSRMQGQDDNI